MNKKARILVVAIPFTLLLAAFTYHLPPVHNRLAWRLDEARTRIIYALNPPDQALFIPQEGSSTVLPTPAVRVVLSTATPAATLASTDPASAPQVSPTSTITPTPLPGLVILDGVKYEDQHNRWNYCGPANLSMALTFWGWEGDRDVVGRYVKPMDKDKNVMPYEMQDFVQSQAEGYGAVVRQGGDLDLVKRLVANGFPVVAEKGYYEYDFTGKLGWLGHYQFVTGYDDGQGVLIVQDTYVKDGQDHRIRYETFIEGWRSFNYVFLAVYPREREAEVFELLGPWANAEWANQRAVEVASVESKTLDGIDQFFASFNVGTSHVALQQYWDAAIAYDHAFSLYANLPDEVMRPYRMMWYQTGPYWAYYYTGRYQDTIVLANTTLFETISEPVLEESFYWRGMAKKALGDVTGAIEDFRTSVELNPAFSAGRFQLEQLGIQD